MNISFSLETNVPFFKDIWGYKSPIPVPNKYVDSIKTTTSFLHLPRAKELYSEDDNILCSLLNGEPTEIKVHVDTRGCANETLLDTPGALTLEIGRQELKINSKLMGIKRQTSAFSWSNSARGDATCEIQLVNEIPEHAPPNGNPISIVPHSITGNMLVNSHRLNALKLLLNNPEKYYLSQKGFFIENPQSMEELAAIYEWEKNPQAPTSEEIFLDPLLYVNHFISPFESPSNNPTSKFAKAVMSGEINTYLR